MLDTFAISKTLACALDELFLLAVGWKQCLFDSNGNCYKYTLNEKDSFKPRLTLTKRPDAKWSLRAEVSLGSWLYGSNLHLPDVAELQHGLDMLSRFVESKSGVVFDAHTERVTRVDFTCDFRVDENLVIPIIKKFNNISLPRYNRQPTNDTTVNFRNGGKNRTREYKIYSKYHERLKHSKDTLEIERSKGIIRLEVALWNDAINDLAKSFNLPDHRANNILTQETSDRFIEKTIKTFGIEELLSGEITNVLKLFQVNDLKTTKELIYYLALREKFGEGISEIPIFQLSKRTCQRRWKKCKELGVFSLE